MQTAVARRILLGRVLAKSTRIVSGACSLQHAFTRSVHASGKHRQQPLVKSYYHMVSDKPLIGETVSERFVKTSEKYPEREAFVFFEDKRRLSYADLREQVEQFAAGLYALGFRKGDRIGMWGPNHMEWILTQFASAYLGLILVSISPAYHAAELKYALNKASCKGLVMCPAFKTHNYYKTLQTVVPEVTSAQPGQIKSSSVPSLSHVIMTEGDNLPGTFSVKDVTSIGGVSDHQGVQAVQSTLQFDDPISLLYTSGTTGHPKGALLSHHNILNNSLIIGRNMDFDKHLTKFCILSPMYHCSGLVLGSLTSVTYGATGVFPSRGFNARVAMEAIHNERCTAICGIPTMFIDILNHPEFSNFNLESLRIGQMGGSPCPIEVSKQITTRMHCKELSLGFGLTETSPVMTFMDCNIDDEELRTTTVGKPVDHVEVKIVDGSGTIVPVNTPGEICCRGHPVMLGYWEDKEKTDETIDHAGWLHSGDIATMDENGYCKIVGRTKDCIIRGGENIYPREIEELLYTHPKIEDVQIVGVPDERLGEELCGWIKLKNGRESSVEEIKDFCKGKISYYKIPRYIKFVDAFPLTVSGKVQKYVIREQMAEELARSSA